VTVRATGSAHASSRHGRLNACAALVALRLILPATLAAQDAAPPLLPTAHDPVPAHPAGYWLAPVPATALTAPLKDFARAVAVVDGGGDATSVAALVASATLDQTPIADHVKYYRGLIAGRQGRLDAAAATFSSLRGGATRTYVAEQALWRLAEVQEQRGEYTLAAETFARLLAGKPGEPDRVAHQLGITRERAGDAAGAVEAHRIVYYDYPLSPDASASGDVLERLEDVNVPFPSRLEKTRARAAALYAARRWALARAAYVEVAAATTGDDHDAAEVRIAAADVQARQFRAAADRLRPLTGAGAHQAEAQLHYALALRGLGDVNGYVQAVRALADGHRQSPYAEEALDGLAVWYVLRDDDAAAAEIFGMLVQRFPADRFAERAAWKPAGGPTATATTSPPWPTSRPAPATSRAPITGRRGSTGRRQAAPGRRGRRHRAFRAHGHRLSQQLLRPAGAFAQLGGTPRCRRAWWKPRAAGGAAAHGAPDRGAAGARLNDLALAEAQFARGCSAFTGAPGHGGARASSGRTAAAGDQRDETRLPAVPRLGRAVAAAGCAAGHLPDRLLAAARRQREAARPRSVSRRRARLAGIHLRCRHRLVGRGDRADADHAGHRPQRGAAARHQAVLDEAAHRSRSEHGHRHRILR
jgi:tetratricopeptide (TPR) repeat protein